MAPVDLERWAAAPSPPVPPGRRPLHWALPALGLLASGFMLWQSRGDLAYLASPAPPIELGSPGAYRLDRAVPGACARIAGQPGPQAVRYRRGLRTRELVPLLGAPVIVERSPTRSSAPGAPVGAPSTSPIRAVGRLERDAELPSLRAVVAAFLSHDELPPPGPAFGTKNVWILTEGFRPRHLDATAGWYLWLAALFALNALWLLRRLR